MSPVYTAVGKRNEVPPRTVANSAKQETPTYNPREHEAEPPPTPNASDKPCRHAQWPTVASKRLQHRTRASTGRTAPSPKRQRPPFPPYNPRLPASFHAFFGRFHPMRTTDDNTLAKSFEPQNIESHWGPEWEKRGYAAPTLIEGSKRFLDPAAAAERHGHAAHGSRVQPDHHGQPHALSPHARRKHAVAAGHGPRGHRHADRRRAATRRARRVAP